MEEHKEGVFLNKVRFTKMVESARIQNGFSYMEAVIHLCEVHTIDTEDVGKYISDVVKDKLKAEAMGLNLLPRANELPFE